MSAVESDNMVLSGLCLASCMVGLLGFGVTAAGAGTVAAAHGIDVVNAVVAATAAATPVFLFCKPHPVDSDLLMMCGGTLLYLLPLRSYGTIILLS